jgi:hypothetical protein
MDFRTIGQVGSKIVSPTHRAPLPAREVMVLQDHIATGRIRLVKVCNDIACPR